eukprot:6205258-Pleurochrysis_carterae.AAC.2
MAAGVDISGLRSSPALNRHSELPTRDNMQNEEAVVYSQIISASMPAARSRMCRNACGNTKHVRPAEEANCITDLGITRSSRSERAAACRRTLLCQACGWREGGS